MIPEFRQCLKDQDILLFLFLQLEDFYELPNETIRTNCNIDYAFKPDFFRAVQNLCQVKASMDETLVEYELVTSTYVGMKIINLSPLIRRRAKIQVVIAWD